MTVDPEWLKEQVNKYTKNELSRYKTYAKALEKILLRACEKCEVMGIVQTRAKAIPSFAEKAIRKAHKYDDPSYQLTDLCGGRVICQTQTEVEQICQFIKDNFNVDEANSLDVGARLKTEEFGYRAVHYVVQIDPYNKIMLDVVKRINDKEREKGKKGKIIDIQKDFGKRKAEIQVQTLLQHAWAGMYHDRIYKSELQVPVRFKRELARVAALLEDADEEFAQAQKDIDAYKLNYDAYMTHKEIRQEIEKWEMVLAHDKGNYKLGHKIGRLAITLEDWDKAIQVLNRFRSTKKPFILRDLGIAKSKAGLNGRGDLKDAVKLNPKDAKAYCALADIYLAEKDKQKALDNYERAFQIAPSDPHILASYLECKIDLVGNINFIPLMHPTLETAIEKCRELADIRIYLPWAFYDIGKFALLLNRPYENLAAYARAVMLSNSTLPIEMALKSIKMFEKPFLKSLLEMPEFADVDWALEAVRRFLRVAIVAKLQQLEESAVQEVEDRKRGMEEAKRKLKDLRKNPDTDGVKLKKAQKALLGARDAVSKAKAEANKAKRKASKAVNQFPDPLVAKKLGPIEHPVIIVAGGCDASVAKEMKSYRQYLNSSFEGFKGTIINGGTTAGISGMVRNLTLRSKGAIRTIGYLPYFTPPGVKSHKSYEIYRTRDITREGGKTRHTEDFTPLEPIQSWIDLIAAGIRPSEVRVLGINGGPISAFEYRMALAFGATVGIVESSGRAANDLKSDSDWSGSSNLLWLPKDTMALRALVNPGESILRKTQIEKYARLGHKNFLKQNRYKSVDPVMMPWGELREDIKDSNRHQAVYTSKILHECGYSIRSVKGVVKDPGFTDKEIEKMAEMEHGRWIIERLKSGWKYGTNRDPENKITPYLIPWVELSDKIKDYDRAIVRRLPMLLNKIGLEIYKLQSKK